MANIQNAPPLTTSEYNALIKELDEQVRFFVTESAFLPKDEKDNIINLLRYDVKRFGHITKGLFLTCIDNVRGNLAMALRDLQQTPIH